MSRERGDEEAIRLPVNLRDVEEFPVSWGNYFLLQHANGEWVLTVAQVRPPLINTPEEQNRIIESGGIPVLPIARVVIARPKLEALKNLIERQLERIPASVEAAAAAEEDGDEEG
jgi:hypothetical protein